MLPPQPTVSIEEFLAAPGAILDVRSPAEFQQGHIPGAISMPLFSNEERAQVGTCYKQVNPEAAMQMGLELVSPRLNQYVEQAKQAAGSQQAIRVHCWRGGMRSQAMGQLLLSNGLKPVVLGGGYKRFRNHCLDTLEKSLNLQVIGGLTGSGKTLILHALAKLDAQVLDLEGLAEHRGSAFGGLGLPDQPTSEHFENRIAVQLMGFDLSQPIWIEDESASVGRCKVPQPLYLQMTKAPLFIIERPQKERVAILEQEYGKFDAHPEKLLALTKQISKRLGGQRTKEAEQMIASGDFRSFGLLLLAYYDKAYLHSVERREQVKYFLSKSGLQEREWARKLLLSVENFELSNR